MRNIFLVFLIILHTLSCEIVKRQWASNSMDNVKPVQNETNPLELLKNNSNIIKFNMSCTILAYNCPPVTTPICVKIRYKTEENKNKTVYIVMVNKCEMDYLNMCYEGINAGEIPMEKCDVNSSNAVNVTHARRKRNILEGIDDPVDNDLHDIALRDLLDIKRGDIEKKVEPEVLRRRRTTKIPKKVPLDILSKESEDSDERKIGKIKKLNSETYVDGYGETSNSIKDGDIWEVKSNESSNKGGDDSKFSEDDEDNKGDKNSDRGKRVEVDNESDSERGEGKMGGYKDNDSDDSEGNTDRTNAFPYHFYPTEKDPYGYYKYSDDEDIVQPVTYPPVNMEQYDADCPKVCPTRDVMVCGMCKDGVYRSFVSVCHMRMFNCKYPKEKVRLISREPCTQISPYNEDLGAIEGRIEEPLNDDDRVLRFLWCKHWLLHHTSVMSRYHPGCKGVPVVYRLKPKG